MHDPQWLELFYPLHTIDRSSRQRASYARTFEVERLILFRIIVRCESYLRIVELDSGYSAPSRPNAGGVFPNGIVKHVH